MQNFHEAWHREGLLSNIMSLVQLNMYTLADDVVSKNAHVYFHANTK